MNPKTRPRDRGHDRGTARVELKIWGARGSLPVSSPCSAQFGSNTMCIELRCGDATLMFDAGSGIGMAGKALMERSVKNLHLFFSHCHYDHIMGLPFFIPFFMPDTAIDIWSGHQADGATTASMIDRFMQRPFFPVGPEVFRAKVVMHDFDPGAVLTPCDGVVIRTALLDHPGRAVGYRIEFAGRVVAMVFDTCHQIGELDPVVLDLIRDADLFLYDATFTDAEFPTFAHFGHSTWQQAVRLAQAAGAARVGLVHHATFRTDDELAQIEQEAQAQFPGAFCGRDTQVITL